MPHITDILNCKSFQNKRVFLLTGGPSLQGFDFTPLQNEITIGINKSFATFPVTYNFSLDRNFLNIIHRDKELLVKWGAYKGIKLFARRKKSEKFSKDIYTVLVRKKHKIGYTSLDIEKGIYPGNNSGFAAVMFAISCGCKEIYLLGLDLKIEGTRTHHHEGYKHQKLFRFEDKLEKFKLQFIEFAPKIKKLGINVVNLNQNSSLRCFSFNNLENILENSHF